MRRAELRDALAADGYAVVPQIAPAPLRDAALRAVSAFLGVDLASDDPAAWYPTAPLEWGVVPVHHHPSQWALRELPALHAVFAALYGTKRLWVSMDRAICRLPPSPAHPQHVDGGWMHWDLDPRTAPVPTLQGMLYLTDSPPDAAPFECVPTLFRDLDAWFLAHPDPDLHAPLDLEGHPTVAVPARAGDLLVWDARLPHRGAPNRGVRPRVSFAVTMWPEGPDAERAERVRCWRDRRAPAAWQGWPGQHDPEPGPTATLGPLGRRLVGVDRW